MMFSLTISFPSLLQATKVIVPAAMIKAITAKMYFFMLIYIFHADSTVARAIAVAVVLCVFAQHFYCHTIKSASTRYPYYIGRLLYALGAVAQGRVANEIPIQRHSPCFGTLSFYAPAQRRTKLVRGFVR